MQPLTFRPNLKKITEMANKDQLSLPSLWKGKSRTGLPCLARQVQPCWSAHNTAWPHMALAGETLEHRNGLPWTLCTL